RPAPEGHDRDRRRTWLALPDPCHDGRGAHAPWQSCPRLLDQRSCGVSVGPFLFLQPLALLGLLALPVLWFLLRATPPEPKRFALPSMALLDDLKPEEETPARTPWWLLLLRMIALALAILGFARPTWAPNAQVNPGGGTLIVVDDGWTSAERWRDIVRTATAAVDETAQSGGPLHVLFTAPRDVARDPSEALDAETARQLLRNARPAPWLPD